MRIISWNVAGDDLSTHAPADWTLAAKEDLIIETILSFQPDIITLQELTGNHILIQLQAAGYTILPPAKAHIGKTYVFVKFDPYFKIETLFEIGPSLMAIINITGGEPVGFVACHLPPFKDQAEERQQILAQIVRELSKRVERYIICGDMNMREAETHYVIKNLQLEDAFLKAGQPAQYKFTWDGFRNVFHQDTNHTPFKCRFDRILSHNINLTNFQFCGHERASNNFHHFLSDHYGLVADYDLG